MILLSGPDGQPKVGNEDFGPAAAHKRNKKKEPRRHTLANGVDYNMVSPGVWYKGTNFTPTLQLDGLSKMTSYRFSIKGLNTSNRVAPISKTKQLLWGKNCTKVKKNPSIISNQIVWLLFFFF